MGVHSLTTDDDMLRQVAKSAWATRLSAPVAALVDDVLSPGKPAGSRVLIFDGPDGPLSVTLTPGDGGLWMRVESAPAADVVELWGPDGRIAALSEADGGWTADVGASGPVRVLFLGRDGAPSSVRLQTEWFSVS